MLILLLFCCFSGRPDQVQNCSITNVSMTSLSISCTEGFHGGLTQSFMLEVRDMSTQVTIQITVDLNCSTTPLKLQYSLKPKSNV